MDGVLEDLRSCSLAYLVADPAKTMPGHDFAPDTDELYACLEFLTLNSVRTTVSSEEKSEADAVVVVLTENWRSSKVLTREIVRARKLKRDLYFLIPHSMKVTKA